MTQFAYTARTNEGAPVRGTLESESRTAALASLRARTLAITSLARRDGARGFAIALPHSGAVSHRATVPFFRSLSALIHAGVPLRHALEVTIEQCSDSRFKEAQRSALSDIENGLPLSEAMGRRPNEFSPLFTAMIRAGELGGRLDEVLERLASVLERERTSRKQLVSMLAYPLVVAAAAIALVVFLLATIVPTFSTMYDQLHVPLPGATAALLQAGYALRSPVTIAAGCASVAVAAIFALHVRTTHTGRMLFEAFADRLPVAGTLFRKSAIARVARLLGTLLASGVNIIAALDVVGDAAGSIRYRECLKTARDEITAGSGMLRPLAASQLFEPLFLQLVRVGEETGALDAMLLRIADYYDVDVATAMQTLGALLEPAMILTLGGAVGFIVSAIFIPLYSLIGNIK